MLPSSTTLPKVDTNCTAPSLIPTVNGNTVRSFSTHGQKSAAKGRSTTVSRSDIRLIQYLDSSALGLVRRWRLIGYFPIRLLPPQRLRRRARRAVGERSAERPRGTMHCEPRGRRNGAGRVRRGTHEKVDGELLARLLLHARAEGQAVHQHAQVHDPTWCVCVRHSSTPLPPSPCLRHSSLSHLHTRAEGQAVHEHAQVHDDLVLPHGTVAAAFQLTLHPRGPTPRSGPVLALVRRRRRVTSVGGAG
jgi:hypothetical protein